MAGPCVGKNACPVFQPTLEHNVTSCPVSIARYRFGKLCIPFERKLCYSNEHNKPHFTIVLRLPSRASMPAKREKRNLWTHGAKDGNAQEKFGGRTGIRTPDPLIKSVRAIQCHSQLSNSFLVRSPVIFQQVTNSSLKSAAVDSPIESRPQLLYA